MTAFWEGLGGLLESSRRAPGELQDSLQESSRRCDSLMEGSGVVLALRYRTAFWESSRRALGELQESSGRAPGQPPGELQEV